MQDFIAVYPNALSSDLCDQITQYFESSNQATRGKTGSGVDIQLKDSYDICITGKVDWQYFEKQFLNAVFTGLKEYIRQYRFAMIGPLALRIQNPQTGQVHLVNTDHFDALSEAEFTQLLFTSFRSGPINLQKYLADQGGYPHWHSEIYPMDAAGETLHRVLLYTFYLNDVTEAGETEFFYQQKKIQPTKGSLLIAPAGFTHTHRGNRPVGSDKYIATSWILFNRADRLYGRAR